MAVAKVPDQEGCLGKVWGRVCLRTWGRCAVICSLYSSLGRRIQIRSGAQGNWITSVQLSKRITFCVQADRSFGRCSTCGAPKHERQAALAKNDYEKAELMKKLIERHNFLQQSERQEDQARLLLARKYPSKYMHLVIDGADSGKGQVWANCIHWQSSCLWVTFYSSLIALLAVKI